MRKTFYLGIVLGIAAAAAVVYAYPLVDLHRESSLIAVQANSRTSESFHVGLPGDRIMAGAAGLPDPTPPGLVWPRSDAVANVQAELFKVRNENGIVIGVASRIYGASDLHGSFIEWAVHLPARGTMYITMPPEASANGYREGSLRAGTREFLKLRGSVVERFVSEVGEADSGATGRIELVAALVGPAVEDE